jgi:CDP-glucose 4,6-dehydratase
VGLNLELWQGKKILVTGHTGFKGSWLTLVLNRLGAQVAGISLAPALGPSLFKDAKIQSHTRNHIIGDIRNFKQVEDIIYQYQPDFVFHLAAQALVFESYQNPLNTIETNVVGSANVILAAIRSQSVRGVLNVTTDKVYQNRDHSKSFTENDPLGGDDIYSASKACSEILTNALSHSFPEEKFLSTARAGNVIGGGDWSDHRLVPDIMRSIQTNTILSLRHPEATRPWQHVLDCIYGYLLIAERSFVEENASSLSSFNFGPNESLSVAKVLEIFEFELKQKIQVEITRGRFLEKSLLQLDSSKSKSELGWEAAMNPLVAIQSTARWYSQFLAGANAYTITIREIEEYLEKLR